MQAKLLLSSALIRPSKSLYFPLVTLCLNTLSFYSYYRHVGSYRSLWNTKQNHLPEPVPDSTSGPGAPDIEIIAAPLTFFKHGAVPAPPGSHSFTIVSSFA